MNVNVAELMIGDWVMDKSIHQQHKIKGQDLFLVEDGILNNEVFTPISLTAEILEKNGFISVHGTNAVCFPEKCIIGGDETYSYEIYYDFSTSCFRVVDKVHLPCKYVHELQHALRLCGRNELADNFKI